MQSQDLVIRTERSVIDVVLKLEEDIAALDKKLEQSISALDAKMTSGFTAQQKQIDGLRSEVLVLNERVNSMNARLGDMQYTLNFGVTAGSLLLVALPLVWGMYKLFTGKISDLIKAIAKEAIREELGHNAE